MTQINTSSELGKRVVTGVFGGSFLILAIVFGGWFGIFLITTGLSLGMLYEFSKMVYSLPDQVEKSYALVSVGWFAALSNLLMPRAEFGILVFCFCLLFAFFLITAKRHDDGVFCQHFRELMFSVFGLVYLGFLPLFLPRIHELDHGVHWTLLFLMIVWAGDTGAYFAGKKYGKRRLYSKVSPKKTVEGGVGGLIASWTIALIYKLVFFRELSWFGVMLIPLAVGLVAQLGDLCESFFKRAFYRKDSGSILPGHGGFLDRFDGVVFSLPVMYGLTRIFG